MSGDDDAVPDVASSPAVTAGCPSETARPSEISRSARAACWAREVASRPARRSFLSETTRSPRATGVQACRSSSVYSLLDARRLGASRGEPSARRRDWMRKPVWATMRWSGRTASPSTCQPRTMVSEASGSVYRPSARMASATRESCGTVAT